MRLARSRKLLFLLPALAMPALALAAAATVDVIQSGRAFSIDRITVARGTIVRFLNRDEFIHHISVDTDRFKFDSGEQPPGEAVQVPFTVSGTFPVTCAIHPKMHLIVEVK